MVETDKKLQTYPGSDGLSAVLTCLPADRPLWKRGFPYRKSLNASP